MIKTFELRYISLKKAVILNKSEDNIDYDNIVENALRSVVKESLKLASKNGLKNDHHFYISFNSKHPGVVIPSELVNTNDDEIKIILQYQFWDLIPEKDKFSVTLSFDKKKKKIIVPYDAIMSFSDPSVGFGLQFKNNLKDEDFEKEISDKTMSSDKKIKEIKNLEKKDAEIVSLDAFRPKQID